MKPHVTAAAGYGVVIFRVDVLFKNGVSAFMDSGEDGTERIILIIVISQSHIFGTEVEGKRMLCLPDTSCVPAEADIIKQKILYLPLAVRIEIAFEGRIFRFLLCKDLFCKRDQFFFQRFKQSVDGGGVHSFLILVEKSVVNFHARIGIAGHLYSQVDHLLQIRSKQAKVGFLFGIHPDIAGLCLGLHVGLIQIGGNALVAVKVALHACDDKFPCVREGIIFCWFGQFGQHFPHLFGGGHGEDFCGKVGQCLHMTLLSQLRGAGLHVPVQQREHMLILILLFQILLKFF